MSSPSTSNHGSMLHPRHHSGVVDLSGAQNVLVSARFGDEVHPSLLDGARRVDEKLGDITRGGSSDEGVKDGSTGFEVS